MNEPTLTRTFALSIGLLTLGLSLALVPADDGLRHVGLAFGPERSWGEVYPFSQFEVFADYDPWWGYDRALRALAAPLSLIPVPPSLLRFAVLKLLALGFVASFLILCLRRGRIADTLVDPHALFLAIALTGFALGQPLQRMSAIRPFAFGTLVLLYSLGKRGALRGLVASGALCLLYPYLAWMYTGPVIVAHWLRGSRSFALGALSATALSLGLQPASFRGLLVELVRSDAVRSQLSVTITELESALDHLPQIAGLALILLWLWRQRPEDTRRLRVEHIVALLFLPISFKYMRYFVDVVIPMLFVAHGAELLRRLHDPFSRLISRGQTLLYGAILARRTHPTDRIPASPPRGSRLPLRVALAIGCSLIVLGLWERTAAQYAELGATEAQLRQIPPGRLVITEFGLQYGVLYARPDLSVIPSCDVGLPRKDILDAYLAYINRGRICELARRTGAAFLVDQRAHHLDPADLGCLQRRGDDGALRVWPIERDARE